MYELLEGKQKERLIHVSALSFACIGWCSLKGRVGQLVVSWSCPTERSVAKGPKQYNLSRDSDNSIQPCWLLLLVKSCVLPSFVG